MTSRKAFAWSLAASVLAIAVFASAWARQTQPTTPPPRPVLIQPTAAQQRFRQTVQQNQVRDQLRKSQVEHQLRQESIERTRRPASSSSTANDAQVDKAQQAQDQLYRAQQRDRVQRYSDALLPQPVPQATKSSAPAHSSSNGGG
jgi:preprotein translocase subunit SecF